jgi:glycosyltransferase involved in cell wall biosynthesis
MKTAPIPVLHLITRLIVGGAQENTLYSAALLDSARYSVQVISGAQTGSEGSLIEEARQQGIRIKLLPELVRQISPFKDLLALIKLYRLLRREPCQLLHTHSSKAGILGRLAGRLAGTPVIIHTVHGWSFHDYMPPWLRKTYILLERWMAHYTQALIAVSQKDIEKGLQAGIGRPEQYHLIRSAIPIEQFDVSLFDRSKLRQSLGIPEQAVVIGFVGRFSPQKNPLDWIRVAKRIGQKEKDVFFLMVGDGPLREQVEEQLQQAGIRNRTVLTGLRRDIPALLACMDIFVHTSLWEGLPRAIVQAMCMRLPVLAYSADGTQEIIQNKVNGYIFQPGEIDKMAEICEHLVHHPELRKALGQRGHEQVIQEFDLQKMIAQISALYDQFIT